MTVRDLQREVTRERILATVLELVAEPGAGDVAVPEVARRSGVSVATIYRYFPTKDALLDAAADEPARQAAGVAPATPSDRRVPPISGRCGGRSKGNSRSSAANPRRRRAARSARVAIRVARMVRGTRRDRGVAPESPEGARLIRLALLLTSSLAFLDLHDRQGLDADAAADDVEWAVEMLQRATENAPRGSS